ERLPDLPLERGALGGERQIEYLARAGEILLELPCRLAQHGVVAGRPRRSARRDVAWGVKLDDVQPGIRRGKQQRADRAVDVGMKDGHRELLVVRAEGRACAASRH